MSDYDDGGMSGILAAQEIQQWAVQAPAGKPAGPPPWWELPALIVAIVALTCVNGVAARFVQNCTLSRH